MDDEEEIPNYEDTNVENIDKVHEVLDSFPPIDRDTYDDDEPLSPESVNTVFTKYRTEADVPKTQKKDFDQYRGSYGRHVALSNTRRLDNVRHLNALDLQYIYDDIPTMRHHGTQIRIRETSEFQQCRSNPEIGGFEAKIGVTSIRREDVDVKQMQSLVNTMDKKKKKGILNFLKK